MINYQEIEFNYKARYFKLGELNTHTKAVWFVLHGYGQLAQYFIKKFDILKHNHICVIAPEGLSTFYLEELYTRLKTGNTRVGASWMTKENRLTDIENYTTYLNAVYAAEIKDNTLPVTILGFSQGAATASRWIANGKINFNQLILWAGVFPTDMNLEAGKEILKHKQTILVIGKNDPLLQDIHFFEMNTIVEKLGVSPSIVEFNGAHDIDEDTLLKLL